MKFDIITIFPKIFDSYFNESIIKRAIQKKIIEINIHDLRDFSKNKHRKVDDTPYGGGAGMLMTPQSLYDCIQEIKKTNKGPVVFFTPDAKILTQNKCENFSKKNNSYILICGRYEGIDQRIRDLIVDIEISIGKYILTGGEIPAMIFVDSITRLIEGALNTNESHEEDSFSKKLKRKKEYPQYTRPPRFKGLAVPDILLSGNHEKINKWKKSKLK